MKSRFYNLIIAGNPAAWESEYCRFPLERLFGYTEPSITSWLSPPESGANLKELESYPTLICNEKQVSDGARLVHLSDLRIAGKYLIFRISDRRDFAPIENVFSEENCFKLRIDFDAEKNNTHWSVKEGDLLEIMQNFRLGKTDSPPIVQSSERIFVVHGHDESALQTVARFLEKIGLSPIVLKEQSDGGRTIIEKFEHHAEEASFAVVLLTPDDEGKAIGDLHYKSRTRQNVILELGYFVGSLTRARVCALKKGNLELPNDILGVLWKNLDDAGGWKLELAKELKQAGLPVKLDRLL